MSLFKEWQEKLENQRTDENQKFFDNYLEKETQAYKTILSSGTAALTGRIDELAQKYDMDNITFMGFLDGINTSLDRSLDLEAITAETEIDRSILLYKLYYNMLNAKANWLYELEEWKDLLSDDERTNIRRQFNEDHRAVSTKVGRNDPCPCGSGKKFKKCCGA